MLAVSCFFLYAVEEVPFPEGAIIFHAEEIAISLVIFFISSLCFLYSRAYFNESFQKKEVNQPNLKPRAKTKEARWNNIPSVRMEGCTAVEPDPEKEKRAWQEVEKNLDDRTGRTSGQDL